MESFCKLQLRITPSLQIGDVTIAKMAEFARTELAKIGP